MKWDRSIELVQVHCQSEIAKVIVSGALEIPGTTALATMNHIKDVDDTLKPRGQLAMLVNLLIAPMLAAADAGFVVLQADKVHVMSGSKAMCVVTALLETGRIPRSEPG